MMYLLTILARVIAASKCKLLKRLPATAAAIVGDAAKVPRARLAANSQDVPSELCCVSSPQQAATGVGGFVGGAHAMQRGNRRVTTMREKPDLLP